MSNYLSRRQRPRVSHDFSVGGMTVQSDARDCDINAIMARYKQTGILPLNTFRNKKGIYADVSEYGDYKDCRMRVEAAEQMFMSMPAKVRDRFRNSPAEFLAFCADPKNAQELIDLGLATPPKDKSSAKGDSEAKSPNNAAEEAPASPSADRK